jgi:hypothetical protein
MEISIYDEVNVVSAPHNILEPLRNSAKETLNYRGSERNRGMLERWVSEKWNPMKSQTPNMPRTCDFEVFERCFRAFSVRIGLFISQFTMFQSRSKHLIT